LECKSCHGSLGPRASSTCEDMVYEDLTNCNKLQVFEEESSFITRRCVIYSHHCIRLTHVCEKGYSPQSLGCNSPPCEMSGEYETENVLVCRIALRINQGLRQKQRSSFYGCPRQHPRSPSSDGE
jgi:hypothetical protein